MLSTGRVACTVRAFADVPVGHYAERGVVKSSRVATHDYSAVSFFTGGRARVVHKGSDLELGEGDVYLVPAGEAHCIAESRDRAAWGARLSPASYKASDLAPLLEPFERERAGASPVLRIPGERQQHLAYLFSELREQMTTHAAQADASVVQASLLGLILAEVKRAAALGPAPVLRATVVGDALAFIELHCLQPLSLGDVARAVRRTPAYVTTALRRATGKSAVEWIIAGRMAEARRRLEQGDERVDIIAERVGYADATHFIRLFRRTNGVTPAAYRLSRARPSPPARP